MTNQHHETKHCVCVHLVGEQLPALDTVFAKGGRWCLPLQKLGVVSFQCATQLLQEAMSKEAARPILYRSIFQETLELDQRIRTCHSRHDQQQLLLNSPAWPRAFGSVACSPPEFVQPPSGASTSRLPDAAATVTTEEPPNEYPLVALTAGPADPADTTSRDPSVDPAVRLADPSSTNPPDAAAASLAVKTEGAGSMQVDGADKDADTEDSKSDITKRSGREPDDDDNVGGGGDADSTAGLSLAALNIKPERKVSGIDDRGRDSSPDKSDRESCDDYRPREPSPPIFDRASSPVPTRPKN